MSDSVNVPVEALHAYGVEALVTTGMTDSDACIVADKLVLADSWGTFTHGNKLLGGYIKRLEAGGTDPLGQAQVASEGPAWAIVDGGNAMGQIGCDFAMRKAIELADTAGVAYVGVRNTNHFGAAGVYPAMAAEANMIGIAMANDIPSVCAPGSRQAIMGTNPLAYAIPAGSHPPILLDIATSTVAGGKVYAATQRGETIPGDWVIDSDGRPTTDGSLYPLNAALAPMTGHKGYGIALLHEHLAGVLTGASISWQVLNWIFDDQTKPTGHGAAFIVINPSAMSPLAKFHERVDGLIDEIHAAPTADGVESVLIPGEMEWQRRETALAKGIELPPDVTAKLRTLDDRLGLKPKWLT